MGSGSPWSTVEFPVHRTSAGATNGGHEEAAPGVEPGYAVLQTAPWPLGHAIAGYGPLSLLVNLSPYGHSLCHTAKTLTTDTYGTAWAGLASMVKPSPPPR